MIKIYKNDINKIFNIQPSQLNIIALKALIVSLIDNNIAYYDKQMILFDEILFQKIWNVYIKSLEYFDPNYNRKTDFKLYFNCIIKSLIHREKINGFALFCPGYTKNGYKNYIGKTNKWKLQELKNIVNALRSKEINIDIYSYYSDVFLENTNYEINSNWQLEMENNRKIFHNEGEKYFDAKFIKNVSELNIFSRKNDMEGYIDKEIIENINSRTYNGFKSANERFYKKLNFTQKEMTYRNDRLITMYKILSDYLNTKKNIIFLPMENMYERENVFSENGTCTMYLKLKKLKEDSNE